MAKSIERIGILRNGDRVIVRKVERVLSKNPKIVATSWLDCSGSGANVYRLVDGRVLLADYVTLTEETVKFSPPRKKVVEEPEPDLECTDTDEESDEPEFSELTLPTFAVLEDENEMPVEPEDGETEEQETEVA